MYKIALLLPFFLSMLVLSCQPKPGTIQEETKENDKQNQVYLVEELLGRIAPAGHPDFVLIHKNYTRKDSIYLRWPAYEAFKSMHAAALQDSIQLEIISATRDYWAQSRIWEGKWNGSRKVKGADLSKTLPDTKQRALKILEYSSMPGTSRHHWGTDIDLNALENAYFESGPGKRIYDWLKANAGEYGYCQVYTPFGESRSTGYFEEKWHWSYMPVATEMLNQYNRKIDVSMIEGFEGSESAKEIGAIENFVNGIEFSCK